MTISSFCSMPGEAENSKDLPARGVKMPFRPYTLSPYDKGHVIEDVWPTIFFGDEVIEEVKRKTSKLSWAKKALEIMENEAAIVVTESPQLPVEIAGWRHDFYSRETGEHLLFEPDKSTRYLDPSTRKYEADEAQHRAWVLLAHERTFRMMRSLGVLYRMTGKEIYAQWVAEGMRRAVEYFGHEEFLRSSSAGKALYFQPLYDAAELALLANAYSLTRNSPAYSSREHKRIFERIFQERMPDQLQFLEKHPLHNMACYVSAALAYAGLLFEQDEWIQPALSDSSGLKRQLDKGIKADEAGQVDGFWYEGTMFYHYYSLCPLVTLWEIDRKMGGKYSSDSDLRKRFTEMFAAPVALADEKLRIPPVGDLGAPKVMNLAAYRHLYEYAAGRLDNERFGPILSSIYRVSGASRVDLNALAYGPDDLPNPSGIPRRHSVLNTANIAVFRSEKPFSMQVMFRAGDYVGGHDHPDRLGISLNAFGEVITPDLGTAGYSLHGKTHNYYRTTIAHNTLFVDEQNQTGDATLELRTDGDIQKARGVISKDGVTFSRTLFFSPAYLVLLDEYSSDQEHQYGWIYHAYGKLDAEFPENGEAMLDIPPLPEDGAFSLLTDRKTTVTDKAVQGIWTVSSRIRLNLQLASDGVIEATACKTPGQPLTDVLGCMLLRVPGKNRIIAAVIEPYKNRPTVRSVTIKGTDIEVTTEAGSSRVYSWD